MPSGYLGMVSANNPPGGVDPAVPVTVDPTTGLVSFDGLVGAPGVSVQAARVGHSVVPNVWYPAGLWNNVGAATQLARDVIRAVPFITGKPFTIDRIAFTVGSSGGAGSRTRIGIYRATGGVGLPSTLLFGSGEFTTDSLAGTLVATFAALTLSDPLYWFVYNTGASAVTPAIRIITNTDRAPTFGLDATLVTAQTHWTVASVLAAFPDSFPGGGAFATDNYPVLAVRGV